MWAGGYACGPPFARSVINGGGFIPDFFVERLSRTYLGLLEGRTADALPWNGWDEGGRQVANGVYFYHVRTEGTTLAGKLVYLR